MKTLALSTGGETIVDDADHDYLSRWLWRASKTGHIFRIGYDRTRHKRVTVLMHRVIMGAEKGQIIDHINRNPMDNRKENLRFCTQHQNLHNKRKHKNNTSGYIGVTKTTATKPWRAMIMIRGKAHSLGLHRTPEEAAAAYLKAKNTVDPEFFRPLLTIDELT